MSHTLLFSQNVHTWEKEELSQDVMTAAIRKASSLAACHVKKIKTPGSH